MNDTPETPENNDEIPMDRSAYEGPSVTIEHELKTSYLDYAMSVIVSRAIPDLRDSGASFMRCMKPTTATTNLIVNRRAP